jgi:hypothetical protein
MPRACTLIRTFDAGDRHHIHLASRECSVLIDFAAHFDAASRVQPQVQVTRQRHLGSGTIFNQSYASTRHCG